MKAADRRLNLKNFWTKDMLTQILNKIEAFDKVLKEIKSNFSQLSQIVTSHLASIKHLETQLGNISSHLNQRPKRGLLSDIVANPKSVDQQCLAIMIAVKKL